MNKFNFPVTDCHVHIIGEPAQYPMVSPRSYTPAPASPQQLDTMLDHTGVARAVVVQLSSYGDDNSCLLDAMAELRHDVRGVIHTNADTSNNYLDLMHSKRICGVRINLNSTGANEPAIARAQLIQATTHCVRNGWHVQMHTTPEIVVELADAIVDCPVPVVLDHFGLSSVIHRGSTGEMTIRRLLSAGHLWIKLSGSYRLDNPDAGALARDLYSDNPDQLVWGSDWPHTSPHDGVLKHNPPTIPNRNIDPADMMHNYQSWLNDDAAIKRIFCDNAERLYGFGKQDHHLQESK